MATPQMLLWVTQAWQDCHKGPRSMQIGMFLGTSHLCHLRFAQRLDSPSDHPIGDAGIAHLP